MPSFQVKLGGSWRDYSNEEDKILKRAFMSGFPSCKFALRGQHYEYDFKNMEQINKDSGKKREIRPPHKWKQPKKPIVPEGKTTVVKVQAGQPGTTIQVPYPGEAGLFIAVNVPASAKPGQAMLVPVPNKEDARAAMASAGGAGDGKGGSESDGKWSTGAKVAAGGAAVVGVAGMAVGGAILGEHVAEHGVDATVDAAGDLAADAGEGIADFAMDAADFIGDGAEEVGGFIMDLF
jgi:hypothetical protein